MSESVSVYQPGDVLLFSGRGGLMSWMIRQGTCSKWTHVAVVAEVQAVDILQANERRVGSGQSILTAGSETPVMGPIRSPGVPCIRWDDRTLLVESTTLCETPCVLQGKPVSGVQAHEVTARVAAYEGEVWLLRLQEPLATVESRALTAHLLDTIGTDYDAHGALISATGPIWRHWIRAIRAGDRQTLYCCESTVDACQKSFAPWRFTAKMKPGTLPPRVVAAWAKQLYQPMVRVA